MEGLIVWLYIVAGILYIIADIYITNLIINWIEERFNKYYIELGDATLAIIATALFVIIMFIPIIFIL